MAELFFDNVYGQNQSSGQPFYNPLSFSSGSTTTGTWNSAPAFPTIAAPDYVVVVVDVGGQQEITHLVAYTAGNTSGTFQRAAEVSTGGLSSGATHTNVSWMCAPTAGTARRAGGPSNWMFTSSAMSRWLNVLGNAWAGGPPAILFRITDSYGTDGVAAWAAFDRVMSQRYNGWGDQGGLASITGTYPWDTVQGSTVTTRGISGYAQQLSSGQTCTKNSVSGDGVLFMWLDDAGSGATGLQLQVDGSTVQTVDGRSKGQYYYAFPNGLSTHSVSYHNNGVTTTTVDSIYVYLNNRSTGLQIWDISHSGTTTATYAASADLAYYLGLMQPAAVQFSTGTNDWAGGAVSYRTNLNTLLATVLSEVTIEPSLIVYSNYAARAHQPYSDFQAENQDFCQTNNAVLMDMLPIVGLIGGSSGADPLGWTVDGIHPSTTTKQQVICPATLEVYDPATCRPPADVASGQGIEMGGTAWTPLGFENIVICTSASPVTISMNGPAALASFALPVYVGKKIEFIQYGVGAVTFSPTGAGVIRTLGNSTLTMNGQYSHAVLTAISNTEWQLDTFPTAAESAESAIFASLTFT